VPFSFINQSAGGVPAPSFSWTSSGNLNFVPNAVALNPTVTAAAGTYTVYLTASNSQGSVQSTQVITVNNCAPMAAFSMVDTLIHCVGIEVKLPIKPVNNSTATAAGANTYSWSFSPAGGLTNATPPSAPNYSANATNTTVPQYVITLKVTNASGTATATHTVKLLWNNACTGIEENTFLSGMSVYPNPASSELHLDVIATVGLKITMSNILGATVFEKSITEGADDITLDVANMPKGLYVLTVENKGRKATRKVIIE
jgi:PKD repeat protein